MSQHRGGGVLDGMPRRRSRATIPPATCSRCGRSTQRRITRCMLDMFEPAITRVRVVTPDVGGGFGPKGSFYPEDVIPAAALKLGAAGEMDRGPAREFPRHAPGARPVLGTWRSRSTPTAGFSACADSMMHETGAYVPWGIVLPWIAATTVPGPYVIPDYQARHALGVHEQDPDDAGARRGPAGGGGHHGAADGSRRARARARSAPRCAAAISSGPSRCPTTSASFSATACRVIYDSGDYPRVPGGGARGAPIMRPSRRARRRRASRAATSASALRTRSKRPASGRTRARRCGSRRTARSWSYTGATPQGQGTRPTLAQIAADQVGCRNRGHRS